MKETKIRGREKEGKETVQMNDYDRCGNGKPEKRRACSEKEEKEKKDKLACPL